jgi:hypothetical protein
MWCPDGFPPEEFWEAWGQVDTDSSCSVESGFSCGFQETKDVDRGAHLLGVWETMFLLVVCTLLMLLMWLCSPKSSSYLEDPP